MRREELCPKWHRRLVARSQISVCFVPKPVFRFSYHPVSQLEDCLVPFLPSSFSQMLPLPCWNGNAEQGPKRVFSSFHLVVFPLPSSFTFSPCSPSSWFRTFSLFHKKKLPLWSTEQQLSNCLQALGNWTVLTRPECLGWMSMNLKHDRLMYLSPPHAS